MGLEPTLIQFYLLTSVNTLFPNKIISTGSRGDDFKHSFLGVGGGHNSTRSREQDPQLRMRMGKRRCKIVM